MPELTVSAEEEDAMPDMSAQEIWDFLSAATRACSAIRAGQEPGNSVYSAGQRQRGWKRPHCGLLVSDRQTWHTERLVAYWEQ
jgi:hypothetical protein